MIGDRVGRKTIGGTMANSLYQAAKCCGDANLLYRKGRHDDAMDQARLALRFLCEILEDDGDR